MKKSARPLQILLVEDSDNDALLLQLSMERSGTACNFKRVETGQELAQALQAQPWDAIIADYVMPKYGGLEALALVKEAGLDVPFIIVSGHINEDTAVAAMKAGAHDYVMKDKLARLAPAIAREMRDAEARREQRASENGLKEEQSFRAAIETAIPSGIAVVDLNGRQSYVNPAFCRMVGWEQTELIGCKPPFEYWPQEECDRITAALAKVINDEGSPAGLELRLRRKNGERFDALLLMTPLKDAFDNLTGWLSSLTDITQRKQAENALLRSHEELESRVHQRTAELSAINAQLQNALAERRRLENELLEITDKERRRIGLDLHDDLGQKLTGVALMSKGLQKRLAKSGAEGADEAARIHTLIQEAMNQARELSHDLVTLDIQAKDLASAMEGIAANAKRNFNISCRFKSEIKMPDLSANVVSQLYKIAQEAVTNAVKHAKSKNVEIRLVAGESQLQLCISNDGAAFPAVVKAKAGIGLRIMSYRAHLIGASFEVKPGEKDGAVVTCSLPLTKERTETQKANVSSGINASHRRGKSSFDHTL